MLAVSEVSDSWFDVQCNCEQLFPNHHEALVTVEGGAVPMGIPLPLVETPGTGMLPERPEVHACCQLMEEPLIRGYKGAEPGSEALRTILWAGNHWVIVSCPVCKSSMLLFFGGPGQFVSTDIVFAGLG